MKIIFYILSFCFLFLSCKKENGSVLYKLRFNTETSQKDETKSLKAKSEMLDTLYSQFGDYITSITPYHYSANFNFLFCQGQEYIVNFLGNNWENNQAPELKIDFSNNQEVTVLPAINKNNGDWIFVDDYSDSKVTFSYFSFIVYYFYQELELPIEYENVQLEQFNKTYNIPYWGIGQERYYCDSVKSGTILKTKFHPLTQQLDSNSETRYNFGVFNPDVTPFIVGDTSTLIHGDFSPITLTMPIEGETKILYSTISFDTENLIQLYAGVDNIPYTSDDIIVYAPEYWKRIKIKMEIR